MYDPPYVLLFAGLATGILSCIPFAATLKTLVNEWKINRSTRAIAELRGPRMLLPFVAIAAGVCVFLASCLQLFPFPTRIAYSLSAAVTAMMAGSVWFQFTRVLDQLENRGMQGIDLDDLSLGKMIPQPNSGEE